MHNHGRALKTAYIKNKKGIKKKGYESLFNVIRCGRSVMQSAILLR